MSPPDGEKTHLALDASTPVRVEGRITTPGTEGGSRHLFRGNADPLRAMEKRGADVQQGRPGRLGERQCPEDLLPHLVAAPADGRAEMHPQIGWLRPRDRSQ